MDHNADSAFEQVNARFQAAIEAIEAQRQNVLSEVKRKKDDKKKVLDDQLGIIKAEKAKVDSDVKAMQHQVEVRNITKKISDLNCKLDTVSTLSEPRENSYIEYVVEASGEHDQRFDRKLGELVLEMGQIKTSKTFPSLCRVTMDTAIANLEMVARLTTINYEGELQSQGGDPVSALGMDHKILPQFMLSTKPKKKPNQTMAYKNNIKIRIQINCFVLVRCLTPGGSLKKSKLQFF